MDNRAERIELLRLLEEKRKREGAGGIWRETEYERERRMLWEMVENRDRSKDGQLVVGYAEVLQRIDRLMDSVERKQAAGQPLNDEEARYVADLERDKEIEREHDRIMALREAERSQKAQKAPQRPIETPPAVGVALGAVTGPPHALPGRATHVMPVPKYPDRPRSSWN